MKAEMLSAVDFTAVIVWSLCEEEKGGNSSDKMSSCQFFFLELPNRFEGFVGPVTDKRL